MNGLVPVVKVAPLSFENCKTPVPPLAVMVIEPSVASGQVTSTFEVMVILRGVGCVSVTIFVASQLAPSVTLIL